MRRLVPVLALCLCLGISPRPAPAAEAAWETFHFKLLLTVLAYDRQLASGPDGPLVFGGLCRSGSAEAEARRQAISAALESALSAQVVGENDEGAVP